MSAVPTAPMSSSSGSGTGSGVDLKATPCAGALMPGLLGTSPRATSGQSEVCVPALSPTFFVTICWRWACATVALRGRTLAHARRFVAASLRAMVFGDLDFDGLLQ